jgi:UDP-N-acetylmuramoyl-L-alanyl-D-glutamate--2,6-diaminopimelate ligase
MLPALQEKPVNLAALLSGIDGARIAGDPSIDVAEVRDDSRAVQPGDLFVAVPGNALDGRRFVSDAAARGAAALVVDAAGEAPAFGGTVVFVPHVRRALARIAANRFATGVAPTLIGVTGTNGKTTTTHLIEGMLAAGGLRVGLVGTIEYRVAGAWSRPAPLTTPGALALHALFADMRGAGATDAVMEASSHALDQGRLDGCRFRVAGLTNLTQDHLDYHGSMDRYLDAKAILFERLLDPSSGVAVLPVDLPEGRAMRARVGPGRTVLAVAATVGARGADVAVESWSQTAEGMRAVLATPLGQLTLVSPMVGDYNLANVVLATGMGIARGLPADAVAAGLARVRGVPGRLERVENTRGVLCLVDYAHTPDALERSLAAVRPLVAPGSRLLTVFGCGGDRDRGKRPVMGAAAARASDLAIVTSDNPRTEQPETIIDMILEGVRRTDARELDERGLQAPDARGGFHVVADRRLAIRRAVGAARPGDVLVITGKGHEDYQIVGSTKLHFDDREEARAAFAAQTTGQGA